MNNKPVFFRSADAPNVGVAVSGTDSYYSKAILLDGKPGSWHLEWTRASGTLDGDTQLFYSNKPNPDLTTDDDWVEDTGFPAPTVNTTTSAKGFVALSGVVALWARLKYTNATGTGTLLGWAMVGSGGGS